MPNHPEHHDDTQPDQGNRGLLLAAGVVAVIVVLVLLHLVGVIGG
jgi:hypothetical protein